MENNTKFFKNCLGVFQGGGCKGVALAGAYQAAVEAGVHLSEVAGASAGSIIAALVGAGASPEFILQKLSELNFEKLLTKPEEVKLPAKQKFISGIIPTAFVSKEIKTIYFHSGLYSSEKIEEWIDSLLSELLPEIPRPIKFKDLHIPTFIIATDLLSANVQVWNNDSSPNDRVSFAVRCSCSIPFFFQPVIEGQNRFIDGGVLSNLPAFVFSKSFQPDSYRPLSNKILAFQLESEYSKPNEWSFKNLLFSLANTVVQGSVEIQKSILNNVYVIPIKTCGVKSTDFTIMNNDKVNELIKSGKKSADSFISNELVSFRNNTAKAVCFIDEEEVYTAFIGLLDNLPQSIYIAEDDTKWSWKLFPTLLYLKVKKVEITVIVSKNTTTATNESGRRNLLNNLGIDLIEVDNLPIHGYYLKYRNDGHQDSTIVYSTEENQISPIATQYAGAEHSQAIQSIGFCFEKAIKVGSTIHPQFIPEITSVKPKDIFKLLKNGVQQYSNDNIQFKIKDINLTDVSLIDQYTREFKYQQIIRLVSIFKEFGIDDFTPIGVKLRDGSISIITPPVFEKTGNKYVAVEGNTRATYYWFQNKSTIKGIIVVNVEAPLPSIPINIKKVRIASRKIPPDASMKDFDYNKFRPIENAIHQPKP